MVTGFSVSSKKAELLFQQENTLCQQILDARLDDLSATIMSYIALMEQSTNSARSLAANMLLPLCGKVMAVAIQAGLEKMTAYEWLYRISEKLSRASNARAAHSIILESAIELSHLINKTNTVNTQDGIEACRRYILSHLEEDLTLQSLAARFNYNPSYLCRRFKRMYGENISAFIRKSRLKQSAIQLQTTNHSISEVAFLFHFANQSHFQKAFKEEYGVTPLHYRSQKMAPLSQAV